MVEMRSSVLGGAPKLLFSQPQTRSGFPEGLKGAKAFSRESSYKQTFSAMVSVCLNGREVRREDRVGH